MSNLRYFTIILMEFHFIAFWEKKVPQKRPFFRNLSNFLTLRAAASIFFCVAY